MATETGTTRLQLATIIIALVGFTMMVGTWVDYAMAATTPEPATVIAPANYALASQLPAGVERLIVEALAAAPWELPCRPTFRIEDIVEEGVAGTASTECVVVFEPGNFDEGSDFEWWAPWLVRHEVAHLATMGHQHDALFRSVLDGMLEPLGIDEVYVDDAQVYPEKVYFEGGCVQGCDV